MPTLESRFRAFVKGGVTFNDLKGSYGSSSTSNGLTTDRKPGYEVGIGGEGANYFTFDRGLSVHTPFGY